MATKSHCEALRPLSCRGASAVLIGFSLFAPETLDRVRAVFVPEVRELMEPWARNGVLPGCLAAGGSVPPSASGNPPLHWPLLWTSSAGPDHELGVV